MQGQPVLLNRTPTLHRLDIHALLFTSINVNFDGDQMTVHVGLKGAL